MKVHYKKTIVELIEDEIKKATAQGLEIKFIELTHLEWECLFRAIDIGLLPKLKGTPKSSTEVNYYTIKLIQETRYV